MTDIRSVGFIGLGTMGLPMAERLVKSGFAVTAWNRGRPPLERAAAFGARAATSPADVARAGDIVFACVTDTDAVEAVVFGPDGVAAGGTAGKLLVDCSSIHPVRTRDFAARLHAEAGMRWVDAPVSGGEKGARDGTLIVMAGGEAADVDRARPAFAAFARQVTHLGPAGAGQAAKVCNQMIIGAEIAAIAEALRFAANFGVAADRLPDALAGGWADSTVLQIHARRMAAARYQGAASAVMMKDMDIACDMGRLTGTPMPVANLVTALYRLAYAQGHADAGQLAPMRLYADGPL
ncbi:MAG: NAD(P)-dependent oxidoreductase [Rhodospirillales bacterium]